MKHEDEDIRYLLLEAVPPLPAPPDRLGAVGRRVRRHRRRRVAVSALAVALVVGLGFGGVRTLAGERPAPAPPAVAPTVLGETRCPVDLRDFPDFGAARYGEGGPLVPDGAVEITACEVPSAAGSGGVELSEPRVLTDGVDEVVRILNRLPARPGSGSAASGDAADQELRCTRKAVHRELAYVLRYPDRAPVTVYTDENCAAVVRGSAGRGQDPALLTTFLDRYRAQLIARTPPATIATPACAPSLPTDGLRLTPTRSGPKDQISINNPGRNPGLPSRLVAVTACRYEVGDTRAGLVRQQSDRDTADTLRQALNAALDRGRVTNCGSYPGYPPPTVLDTLLVADATGATAEFWLRRAPCPALVAGRSSGITPTEALLATVDGMLGPARR
ncbi:hypothetical protein [Micromonospora endolithica]|uniref:Uncharacterized protein n=1 Tax=Micromonospora endolithica TaxID=230091 RepID=A0A3A9Z276_9ACTN|nr:hypothetical protein [Micromonospora endolithica]RKN42139.1 hypothetical protein D7223_23710 [Micromonospora endolithica]TWJ19972.1 hypothetical protein JD76_00058 [Micromonospora endolithica]